MNRADRRRAAEGYYALMRRLSGSSRMTAFEEVSMQAIAKAAILLGRDPEELGRTLSDGRLAVYLRDAEASIPLPLDDSRPTSKALHDVLDAAADDVKDARERLQRRIERVQQEMERVEAEFRERSRRVESARFRGWPL